MIFKKKAATENKDTKNPPESCSQDDTERKDLVTANSTLVSRLEELEALPHRNKVLHWGAFTVALMSLLLLAAWVFSSREPVQKAWIWIDIGISVVFALEFFTRSGFRWTRFAYLRTHFFDFIAIIPVMVLVQHGFYLENVWVWIILVARFARAVDRILGDGFVQRVFWSLIEGFEEEITDRVLGRIIARIQADMDRAGFSRGVAQAFVRNKSAVLQRVRAATPHDGVVPEIARIVGLDKALERAEERAYDAIVEIVGSEEVDKAVRDVVNSSFSRMRNELGRKSWRQHLNFWNKKAK